MSINCTHADCRNTFECRHWECFAARTGTHWERLVGHKDALVRAEPLPQGYLWQYRKKYGFASTLEVARDWVETLAEFNAIAPKNRWLAPL